MMFPPPSPDQLVVWAEHFTVDVLFCDAWDGVYWDAEEALRDAAGGLTHFHDVRTRPALSRLIPWPGV
jgi:hypothetical protein